MNPSATELNDYMHRHHPGGSYISAYEAGFCGFWIHWALVEGLNVCVRIKKTLTSK